jgi:hypothetical protein
MERFVTTDAQLAGPGKTTPLSVSRWGKR